MTATVAAHWRPARNSLALALLARIPIGALSLLIVLAVRGADRSFALAGLASGACSVGIAISSPVAGRLADRFGQAPVLATLGVATGITFVGLAALPDDAPSAAYVAVAVACGISLPPISASTRVVWRRLLEPEAFDRVVALDATLQEIAFLLGPLLVVAIVTGLGADTALVVMGVGWALVTFAFARLPESRAVRGSGPVEASWLGPIGDPGVRTLTLVAVAFGAAIGASELGVITIADEDHARRWLTVLYAVWGLASVLGGTLAIRRPAADPFRRAAGLLAALTVSTGLLTLAAGVVSLGPLLFLAGVGNAPLFATLYATMAAVAPLGRETESYSLQTMGLTVGIALGTTSAGLVVNATQGRWAFPVGAAAVLAGLVRFRSGRDHLRAT